MGTFISDLETKYAKPLDSVYLQIAMTKFSKEYIH